MTSDNPHEAMRRWRWPRFKLSTILVLVAITAWGMSIRHAVTYDRSMEICSPDAIGMGFSYRRTVMDDRPVGLHAWATRSYDPSSGTPGGWALRLFIRPNELVVPAIALSAFFIWKLGCAIRTRWNRRREAPATSSLT